MLFDYKNQLKTGERCLYMWPSVPGWPRPGGRGRGQGIGEVGPTRDDIPLATPICPCIQTRKGSY